MRQMPRAGAAIRQLRLSHRGGSLIDEGYRARVLSAIKPSAHPRLDPETRSRRGADPLLSRMIGRRAAFPRRQTRAKLDVGRLALVPFGTVEVPGSPTPGPDQRQAPLDTQSWSWALGAPNCQLPTRERANLGLAQRPTRSASRLCLRPRDAGQSRMSRGPRPVSQSEPSSLRREPCLRGLRSRIANGSFSARDWATSHRDDLLTA